MTIQVRQGVEAIWSRIGTERRPAARGVTMPPQLESFADDIYDGLAPLAWADDDAEWHLAHFCAAIGAMFQAIADVARDTPDGPGWSAVMDVNRCPDGWLGWLAQFAGVTLIAGSTPAEKRVRIVGTDGFRRGTAAAITVAAQATLTGSQVVYFRERNGGDAYALQIVTRTTETPNPAATLAAILAQKPGGIVLDYHTVAGWDYRAMTTAGGTYTTLATKFATYYDLRDNTPTG